MTEQSDLADHLDSSFGDGPPLPPADVRLRAGRRALRRRRLTTAAGAVAVVAVLGTAYTVLDDDSTSAGGGVDVAGTPTPARASSAPPGSPTGSPTGAPATSPPTAAARPSAGLHGSDVWLEADGSVLKARGVTVTERIANPLASVLPHRSLGLAYSRDGEDYWALLEYDPVGGSLTWDPAGKSFATLQQWIDDMVALQTGEPGLRLVRFGAGETLLPRAGVEILAQTGAVDLPDSFAGPGDRTAVAMVTYEGMRWFVLAREIGGSEPEYLPTAGSVGGATIDDFLAYAADQYGSGEGLR
ncbi:hypothetical protein [Nocardioides sp. 1609]|uniref:hypothetical protein n=1 Tax=Nocardioides sp. 1609 TaxID=2508327 RepID=UPI00106F90B2|nr:hypothetical protein [Nocardioides sp. 1609]